jgi:AcrR family transcriptional regulator
MREPNEEEMLRLREVLLDLCGETGYEQLELNDLLKRSGMSEEEFHRYYPDLDACFAAVLGGIYDEFFVRARVVVEGQVGWRDRMRATAYALLRFLRADERVARLAAVEVQYAGPDSQRLFQQTFSRLVELINEGSVEADGPDSPGIATAIGVGGVVFARVQEAVSKGELGLGEDEIPELMYGAVFPYLGAEAAEEELRLPPPPDH